MIQRSDTPLVIPSVREETSNLQEDSEENSIDLNEIKEEVSNEQDEVDSNELRDHVTGHVSFSISPS